MSVILINPFEVPAGRVAAPADLERAVGSPEIQRLTAGSTERFLHYPGSCEIIRT